MSGAQPTPEAMKAAIAFLEHGAEHGHEGANGLLPSIGEIARAFAAFALLQVQAFRIAHGKGDALAVAKRAVELCNRSFGKVGMGVMEQEIACDVEAFAVARETEERDAIAKLLQNYIDAFGAAALYLPLIAEKVKVVKVHLDAVLARGSQ